MVKEPMETALPELRTAERNINSLSTVTLVVTLIAVTMTFGAIIAVFVMRASRDEFWSHIQLPSVLWLSTALLLSSSFVYEAARNKLQSGDLGKFHHTMARAVALGVCFLFSQLTAWLQLLRSGVVLQNNPHSWFILLFSGLHGAHILLGLSGLIYLYWRSREPASGPKYQLTTRTLARSIGVFWHYMDGMWLLLFALLVFWRR
jgi:cytochrome c oxidase subunit 3